MNEEEYRLLLEEEKRRQKDYKPNIFTAGNLHQDLNSQYDKGVTSYSLPKLQDYRGERQSATDRMANGLVNFGVGVGANTVNGIVQTAALIAGAIPAAVSDNWSMQDNLDNPLSKFISQIQESVREEMPIYKREEYEAKGLGKVFDSEFWGGTVMDGAAFAASAYLSGMGFSKAFSAGAKALKLGERGLMGMAGETLGSTVSKGIGTGDALINPVNLNFAQKVASSIYSSVSESAVESLDSYKSLKQMLTNEAINKKIQNGGLGILSEEEEKDIENKATTASNINFALNVGLTGMSDYIQFGKFFGGLTEEAIKARKIADAVRITDKGYELKKAEGRAAKFYQALKPYAEPIADAGSEVVEEGGQFMIQKTLENYYAGDEQLRGNIGESLVSAFKDLKSPEGIESMLAGAVIGGGTAAVKLFSGGLKANKEEKDALDKWIKDANEKYNWQGIQEGILREDNKRRLDLASRSGVASMAMEEAVKNADGFTYQTLKDINFTDAAMHHLRGGTFQDFIDKIDDFGKASASELMDVYGDSVSADKANSKTDAQNLKGGIENSDYAQLASELKQQAMSIKESYDKVTRRYGTAFSEDETALISTVNGLVGVTSAREEKVKEGLKKLGFDYDAEIIGKVKSDEEVNSLYEDIKSKRDQAVRLEGSLNEAKSALASKLNKDATANVNSLRTDVSNIQVSLKDLNDQLLKADQELRDSVDNVSYEATKGDGKVSVRADYMKQFKKARQQFMNKLDERANKEIGQTTLSSDAKELFNELEKIQKVKNQYVQIANKFAGEKAKEELDKFNKKIRNARENTYLDRLTTVHNQNGEEIKLDTGWYYVEHKIKDKDTGELKAHGNQRTYFEITGFEMDMDKYGNKVVNAVVNDTRLDSDTLDETTTEKRIPLSQLDGKIMKLSDKYDNAQDMSEKDKFYIKNRGRVIDYQYRERDEKGKFQTKTITGVVSYNKAGYLSVAYFDENENSQRTKFQKIDLGEGRFMPLESFQTARTRPANFSQSDFRYAEMESQYMKIYTKEETKQWLELQSVKRAIIGIENDINATLASQAAYAPSPIVKDLIQSLQDSYDNLYSFYEDTGSTARTVLVQSRTFKGLIDRYLSRKKSFETTLEDLYAKLKSAKAQQARLNSGKGLNIQYNYETIKEELDRRVKATEQIINEYKSQNTKAAKHIEMLRKLNDTKIKPLLSNIINNDIVRKDDELLDNVLAAIQGLDIIGLDEDYMNNELTPDQTYAIAEYLIDNPETLTLMDTDGTEKVIPNKFFATLDSLIDTGDADQMMKANEEFQQYKDLLKELSEAIQGDEVLEANKALRNYEREERVIRANRQAKLERDKDADSRSYKDRLSSLDYLMPEEIVLEEPKQRKLELLNFENALMQKLKGALFPNVDTDLQKIEGYNPHVNELIAPLVYSSEQDEREDSKTAKPSILVSPIKSVTSSNTPLTLAQANGNDRHHWAFAKVLDDANLKGGRVFIQWRTSAPTSPDTEAYDYKEDYGTGHKNIIGVLVNADGSPVRVNYAGQIDSNGKLLAVTHLEEPTSKTTNGYNRFRESDELEELEAEYAKNPTGDNASEILSKINGLKSTIEQGIKEINDYRNAVLSNIADKGVSNHSIINQSFGIPVLGNVSKSPKTILGDDLAQAIHDGVYEIIIAQGESHPMLPGKKLKSGRAYLVNKNNGRAVYLNTRKLNINEVNGIINDILAMSVIDATTMLRTEESVKNHMNNIRDKIHFTLAPKYPERTVIKNGKKDEANSTEDNMVIYDETRGESEDVLKSKMYVVGFVPNSASSKIEYGLYAGKDADGKPIYDTKIVTVEDLKERNEEGRLFEDFLANRWHNVSSLFTHKGKDGKIITSVAKIDWMLDNVITTRLAPSTQIQNKSTYITPSMESVDLAVQQPAQQQQGTPAQATDSTSHIVSPNGVFMDEAIDKVVLEAEIDGNKIQTTLKQLIELYGAETANSYDNAMTKLKEVEKELSTIMDATKIMLNVKDFVKPELQAKPQQAEPVQQPQPPSTAGLAGLAGVASEAVEGQSSEDNPFAFDESNSGGVNTSASSAIILDDFLTATEALDQEPKLTAKDIEDLKRMPVAERMRKYGVEFKIVKGLIDNKAFGKFQRAINKVGKTIGAKVLVSEDAPIGTVYHEEFHVVEKTFLTPSQRRKYYDEYRTVNNKPNMSDAEVSESLAEEFRYYAVNRDVIEGNMDKSLITRVMKYLYNRVMKMLEFMSLRKSPKIKNLFEGIYSGAIANNPKLASIAKNNSVSYTVNQRQDIVKSMVYQYYTGIVASGIDLFTYLNDISKRNFNGKEQTFKQYIDEQVLSKTFANSEGVTIEEKIFNRLYALTKKSLEKANNIEIANAMDSIVNKEEIKESFFKQLHKMNPSYTIQEQRVEEENKDDKEVIDIADDIDLFGFDTSKNENETVSKDAAVEQIPSNELDPKRQISTIVKQLLVSVVARQGNKNEFKLNSLGLKQYTDLSSTINSLYRDLSDVDSIDEMYEILERKASSETNGSVLYKDIAKRMKYLDGDGKQQANYASSLKKWAVENAFLQQFSKTNLDLISVRYDKKGFRVFNESQEAAILKYKNSIRRTIVKNNLGKPELGKLLTNNNLKAFLDSLGIEYPIKLTLKSRERDLKRVQDMLDGIAKNVEKELMGKGSGFEILNDWTRFNDFLIELNKHDNQVPSFSAYNAENKKVYAIQQQNYLTKMVKKLKQLGMKAEDAVNNALTTIQLKENKRIAEQNIFNPYHLRNIKVSTLLGLKGSNNAQKANKLSEGDMLFMFANLAFQDYVPFIFPADKSTYNVISGMLSYKANSTVDDIADLYMQQMEQELREASMYINDNSPKQKTKNLFPVTKSVLMYSNDEKAIKVKMEDFMKRLNGANDSAVTAVHSELRSLLTLSLNGFIQNELFKLERSFASNNVATKGDRVDLTMLPDTKMVKAYKEQGTTSDQILMDLLRFYTGNMMLQGKYLVGNFSNYKSAVDFAKRSAGALATKSTLRSDEQFVKDYDVASQKLYTLLGVGVKPIRFGDGVMVDGKATFNALVVDDIKIDSRNNKAVAKLKEDFAKAYEAYGDVDVTDAQGFEHIDLIRFRGISEGTWTDAMEEIYRKDLVGEATMSEIASITMEKTQYYGRQYLPNQAQGNNTFDQSNNATFYKLSVIPVSRSLAIHKSFRRTIGRMDAMMRRNQVPIIMVESSNKVGRISDNGTLSMKQALSPENDEKVNKLKQVSFLEDYGTQVKIDRVDKTKQTKATQHRKLIMLNTLRNGGLLTIGGKKVNALSLNDKLNDLENMKLELLLSEVKKDLNLKEDVNGMLLLSDMSKLANSVIEQLEDRESPKNVIDSVASTLAAGRGIDLLNNKLKIESIATAFVNKIIKQKVTGSSLPQAANVFDRVLEAGSLVYNADGTRTPITDENGKVINQEELKFYDDGYLEVYLPNHFKKYFGVKGEVDERLLTMVGFRIPVQGHNSMERIKVKGFLPANLGNMMVVPYEITKKAGSDFDIDKLNLYYYGVDSDGKVIPDYTTEAEFDKWYNANHSIVKKITHIGWARNNSNGYEVSSKGDTRFSALYAKLKDGRTIEEAYQLDIKGYRQQGNDWRLGKGKAPLIQITKEESWNKYKDLWRTYLNENPDLKQDLKEKANGKILTDMFASTDVSQARALSELLNEENKKVKVKDNYAKYKQKALDNAMLSTYIDVLGSEEIQNMMLIPIADDELKSAVSSVREVRGVKPVTFANYFNPASNVAMKTSFEGGKQVLGAVALHNTHHSLSQFARLEMNGALRFANYNKSNGRVNLYATDTTNGELISDNISQLMSAAVDVAKDDYIKDINLTLSTSSVYLLLVRAGIPLKDVVYFMSQPIITDYVNEFNRISSNYASTQSEVNTFDVARMAESNIMANRFSINTKAVNLSNMPSLTTEYLKEGLGNTMMDNQKQYYIFREFIGIKEKADALSRFMNSSSYDTKGVSNTLVQANDQAGKFIRSVENIAKGDMFYTNSAKGMEGFFTYTGADGVRRDTFLGRMKNIVQKSTKILSPIYNNNGVSSTFTKAVDLMEKYEIRGSSEDIVNKYASIINGIVNSSIVNMKIAGGASIADRQDYLFKGHNNLANRIGKFEQAEDYKFLKALSIDSMTGIISLGGSSSLDVYETDDLVDAFYELEAEHPDLANDLIDAILLQSGVHNSPTTYLNVIPFEKIMERVGQFYQNDYFEEQFEHLVLLNDYKKLLQYGDGVSIENPLKPKRKAYYTKGKVDGTFNVVINGIVYEDNGGVITTNGQLIAETVGAAKRDYKKRGFVQAEREKSYTPLTYSKYLGIALDENLSPTELDRYIQDNAKAISEGKITVDEVVKWAKKCGNL